MEFYNIVVKTLHVIVSRVSVVYECVCACTPRWIGTPANQGEPRLVSPMLSGIDSTFPRRTSGIESGPRAIPPRSRSTEVDVSESPRT